MKRSPRTSGSKKSGSQGAAATPAGGGHSSKSASGHGTVDRAQAKADATAFIAAWQQQQRTQAAAGKQQRRQARPHAEPHDIEDDQGGAAVAAKFTMRARIRRASGL